MRLPWRARLNDITAMDEDFGTEWRTDRQVKKLQGLVITFVDTTKQVDDQEQIEDMAKALREAVRTGQEKERFLSQMSHDMRTPMTAISGLTQIMLQKTDIPEDIRDNLEKVKTSSDYMVSLIEEILETSRINAGKVVTVSTAVREEAVLNSVATIVKEQADQAGLEFEMDVRGCEGRYVMMDEKHVERALMNLLSNSIRFTPAGGQISFLVSVRYRDGRAEYIYVVRDNGVGISEDFQQKMFLPFEQSNESLEYNDGTGLGLFICKNLIELMGGTISCWSKVGEGTEFTVKISYLLASEEQIAVHSHQAETFEDQALYGKNILIVEDNNINAEVIMELLNTKGIHSEWARDGQEAVNIFESRGEYHFQAILMDLMMPVKNGVDAAKDIRSLPMRDAEEIPIIALSADVTEDAKERVRNAGMNVLISKPIDRERLFTYLAKEFAKTDWTEND